jgi:hypothetical protein
VDLTEDEKKVFDGLSENHKAMMGYSSFIMKAMGKNPLPDGYVPEWMHAKIDYLVSNGFVVDKTYRGNGIIVESDISGASFAQKLKIWDIEPLTEN